MISFLLWIGSDILAQLFFRYSTMNAGKSLEILKIAHNYEEQGKTVLLFAPKIDTRYGVGKITSRIGISKEAISIEDDTRFIDHIMTKGLHVNCVLIDEGQFLTKQHVEQLVSIVDIFNIPVIVYGLKNTFKNELFPGTLELLKLADKIEEIKTVCWYCDNKAICNLRIDGEGNAITEGQTIQIGGNESYLPVCRKCYYEKCGIQRLV